VYVTTPLLAADGTKRLLVDKQPLTLQYLRKKMDNDVTNEKLSLKM